MLMWLAASAVGRWPHVLCLPGSCSEGEVLRGGADCGDVEVPQHVPRVSIRHSHRLKLWGNGKRRAEGDCGRPVGSDTRYPDEGVRSE